GILLIMKQIPHALGVDADAFVDESTGRPSVATLADAVLPLAVAIAVAGIAVLLVWEKIPTLKNLRAMPGPLAAVLLAVGMNEAAPLVGVPKLGREHLVSVPPITEWAASIGAPDVSALARGDVWVLAFTLAAVASIESLLN